jgi:hypothetical protein
MSNNSSAFYFYTVDSLLTTYGSTWILDTLNMYLFTFVSVLGLVLSILSLVVFCDKDFTIALYTYLRVYSANNIVLCFLETFNFFYTTYRIIPWSNSYWTQFYYNYILIPVSVLCYFYSGVLSVIIQLDRIGHFAKPLKRFTDFSPLKLSIFAFLLCVLIDIPYNLVFVPGSKTAQLVNSTSNFTIYYSTVSAFSTSELGLVLTFLVSGMRDIFIMLVEIVLNVVSVVLIKRYFAAKKRKYTAIMIKKIAGVDALSVALAGGENRNMAEVVMSVQGQRKNGTDRMSRWDRKANVMVFLMCTLSILVHMVTFVINIYPYFDFSIVNFILYFVGNFVFPLKCVLDFILFYSFNSNFKPTLLRYLRFFNQSPGRV